MLFQGGGHFYLLLGEQLTETSVPTGKSTTTNSVYEYVGIINFEIYHVETKGLDQAQDGFTEESMEC